MLFCFLYLLNFQQCLSLFPPLWGKSLMSDELTSLEVQDDKNPDSFTPSGPRRGQGEQ